MKKLYLGGIAAASLIFGSSYFYYKSLNQDTPLQIAKSTETIINVDKIRFTFKIASLSKSAKSAYLLALKLQEDEKVNEAVEFYDAAIGFALIKYTKDDQLLNYVIPKIEANIDIIESHRLDITEKELQQLVKNSNDINFFVENKEKEIWSNIQKNYIEFRTNEVEKINLYKVLFSTVGLSLIIILLLYLNRRYLKKDNKKLSKKLEYAADEALAGYWEWHLNSNYLYLSKGWKKFLGYEEDELEEHIDTFKSLLHPDDMESTFNTVDSFINNKIDKFEVRLRIKAKNGEYKWVSSVGSIIIDKEKNEKIFFGFNLDINDLVTTKEMLIARSKAAMLGEMISLISHQFKQPLNIISLIASNQILKLSLGNSLEKKSLEKDANESINQVKYLTDTIDTFKNFLKPDKKKSSVYIEDIIKNSIMIVNKNITNHNIEIIKEFSNTPKIDINSSEFMQVIINLINNSKDAFEINRIKNRKIWLRTYEKEKKLFIEIEDTAGGIAEDKIGKIFDAYYTTKDQLDGTGLGLYIVKIIVEENLKGKISVQNTHSGVKFILKLIPHI